MRIREGPPSSQFEFYDAACLEWKQLFSALRCRIEQWCVLTRLPSMSFSDRSLTRCEARGGFISLVYTHIRTEFMCLSSSRESLSLRKFGLILFCQEKPPGNPWHSAED